MSLRIGLAISAFCASLSVALPARATTISIAAPGNRLSGAAVVSSTQIAANFPATKAVDDLVRAVPPADEDHGLIFSNSDFDQRLGLSGKFGPLQEIRLWTIPNVADARNPNTVVVRSSLNEYSGAGLITAGNFETLLGVFPLGFGAFTGTASNTDNKYATMLVNAPVGTRSLYLNLGPVFDAKGERVTEIQAFVPEPSSMVLLGLALFGLAGAASRRC